MFSDLTVTTLMCVDVKIIDMGVPFVEGSDRQRFSSEMSKGQVAAEKIKQGLQFRVREPPGSWTT
jgi:hypothetical protein